MLPLVKTDELPVDMDDTDDMEAAPVGLFGRLVDRSDLEGEDAIIALDTNPLLDVGVMGRAGRGFELSLGLAVTRPARASVKPRSGLFASAAF